MDKMFAAGRPTMAQVLPPNPPAPVDYLINAIFVDGAWIPFAGNPTYFLRDYHASVVDGVIEVNNNVQYLLVRSSHWSYYNNYQGQTRGLRHQINAPGLRGVYVFSHLRVLPGAGFSGFSGTGTDYGGTLFSINGELWVHLNYDSENATTLSNVEFHTRGPVEINNTHSGYNTVNGGFLFGNATYVAHNNSVPNPDGGGDAVRFYGNHLTVGSRSAAPQVFSPNHTLWLGSNGKFYGVLGDNRVNQFNSQFSGVTFTGMLLVNIFSSNVPDSNSYIIGTHPVPRSQENFDYAEAANNRVYPSRQCFNQPNCTHPNCLPGCYGDYRLLPGALNMNTRFMAHIGPYMADGEEGWQMTTEYSYANFDTGRLGVVRR